MPQYLKLSAELGDVWFPTIDGAIKALTAVRDLMPYDILPPNSRKRNILFHFRIRISHSLVLTMELQWFTVYFWSKILSDVK